MKITQLSLFVENRPGALKDICKVLQENQINISTLSLADTQSFGILRLLVKEHEKARIVLEKAGFVVKTTEVLAIPVPNCPGGLSSLLETLQDCQVEYMYAFASELHEKAVMVFRFADPDKALAALKAAHSEIIQEAELFTLA
ncbi:MAG: ACT domain-containing protein [Lentisphaerae bacterium]|nr:ACT domain-containing protein [Lentisphaerota bacterium]